METSTTPKKRKRSNETTEQRQARKQQQAQELLRMQQVRRDELLAREAEQERLLQLSRVSTTFLQDDETTLDGTHADMYDSMDLEDDEDWVPSDSDLAAAPQRRVGRIVQDSSDEEEVVPRREAQNSAEQLEPVKMLDKEGTNITVGAVTAVPRVVHQPQSAAPTFSENPNAPGFARNIAPTLVPVAHAVTKNDSRSSVTVQSDAVSVPLSTAAVTTIFAQIDRVNSAQTANDAAHRVKSSAAALPASVVPPSAPRSYAYMSATDIAQDLHQRILESCVGSAASDFINNSRSALNDRTAATVNGTFNQLIASIRTLSEDAKISLYHVAFDWFESLYRENVFDAPLDAIEARLKGLRNGQKTELSRLQKDLDVVDDEMEATLQQLARAGFDVFEKLGKFKDKAVRRMRKKLDTYNGLVSSTRVSVRKRLERLRLRLQETSELWGCVDSESSNSGSDSDGNVSTSRGVNYSTHVPNFPAAKMAKSTLGTSFSRSHSNNSQNLSRSSTNSSGRQGGPSAKRTRSGDEAVSAHNYEDNDFSVDYEMHHDDVSMAGAESQLVRGKGNSVSRAVPSSSALSRTGSHSRTGTTSVNLKPVCSKRVHKEMDFIFGSAKDRRNSSLAKKNMGDGSVRRTASGRDLYSAGEHTRVQEDTVTDPFVPLYRRAPAPSVLDLPRYIRYHGRVTVLEGPLMGTVVVPATIERSPSYTLGTASASWPGATSSMEDAVSGAGIGNSVCNDRSIFHRAAPAPPSASSRLPERSFSVPVSSALAGAIIEPEQVSLIASLDSLDESLVDVVLSSMANPFAVDPPLHLRRQFYQLPSLLVHSSLATQAADEVWAEQFVNHLVAETSATGIVRGLSLAATSAVQVILQRLALYEEATARSSQLHPTHSPRISASGFDEKKVFAELVSLAAEKISRLKALFACVATRLFLTPVAASVEAAERVSNVKQLAQCFDSLTRVACSRAPNVQREETEEIHVETKSSFSAGRSLSQNLSQFLRLSTIEDSKSDELAVFVALSLLRIKVKTFLNCALHTLETAKSRILIDTNDAMSVLDRIEEEVADWDVMNSCFSALLAMQQELTSALLANHRLTLAVLHFLSEIPPADANNGNNGNNGSFERGIGGVAKLTAALFYEILTSLRTLHVSINTARASSSASMHGTRVWMCYDASREQANGVIATYPKYMWRDVVLSIYTHIARNPHSRGGEKLTPEGLAFFDEKQFRRAIVNPVMHRQRQRNESRSDDEENDAYLSAKESLWAVVTIFTHLLRSVKLAELASAATPSATNNRASSRVEGAWSLLKGLAHASLESTMSSAVSEASEMISFFGPEAVRLKLKLSPSPGAAAMPLQQQVMEMLSLRLSTAAQGAFSAGTADGASSADKQRVAPDGAIDGSLLSEVDRLLQRVPIHQQHAGKTNDVPSSVTGNTAAVSTLPAVPQLDASAVFLCLQWQAGLVTFQPFPPNSSQPSSHEPSNLPNVLLEADLKRLVESQRAQFATLEPVLHLLRHSLQLQQNSSKLVNVFGAKAFVDTALGASLAAGAMILGNIDALLAARCTISVDTQTGSFGDVVTTRYPVTLLVMPFFTELLNVVHVCLATSESSASKDGLPFSAAYVLSQFILYLDNWHRASRQLLSVAHSSLNIDPASKSYLSATFNEEECKLWELLSAALRLRPVPVIPTYKSSNVASKASPSGLVASFLTLLNSLTNSINKSDISVLDPSALFRTAAGETCITETARKMRMHKGNTSPGCCLAICQALGTLVSLMTNVTRTALSPPATTAAAATWPELHRSGLAPALVTEVNDCLEKIDQTATSAGANALFGNWLKVVFWLPILQASMLEATERRTNPTCLPLVSAYFPALVCVWVGCAALGEATVASRRILQQIDFATFHRLLVQLAPVLVQQLQTKSSSIGVTKLSSADMQCLRLEEAFTQVNLHLVGTNSTNASVFVVKFLRLLSAGSASSVLAALVVCSPITSDNAGNGGNGGHTYSFPAVHRASFEAVNVQISRELLKCLQVLKLEIFRCGENPKVDSVEAQQKHALEASATKLKGLFGDIAYLYRVLVVCEVPSAEFHPTSRAVGSNDYTSSSNLSGVAVRLTARLLRSLQPFPRMVTLDLAFSFLGDIVEQDAMASIGLMFKHAARGDHASPEQHSALKKDLHRNFWCNVPKYLLLASDTPYS
eukprot:gene9937-11653_t